MSQTSQHEAFDEAVAAGEPDLARQLAVEGTGPAWELRRLELALRWGDQDVRAALAELAARAPEHVQPRCWLAQAEAEVAWGAPAEAVPPALRALAEARVRDQRYERHRAAALLRALGHPVGVVPESADAEAVTLDRVGWAREAPEVTLRADRLAAALERLQALPPANRSYVGRLVAAAVRETGFVVHAVGQGLPLVFAPAANEVWREGQRVARWKRSKRLYTLLFEIAVRGRQLDRAALYERVWELKHLPPSSDNAVFVAVVRMRKHVRLADLTLHTTDAGRYVIEPQPTVLTWDGQAADLASTLPETPELPADPNPILGRQDVLEEALELVDAGGLVTVIGPPGIGKTRFALAVAREARAAGGVVWCELDAGRTLEDVVRVVADALGVPASGATSEHIAAALAGRPGALLVLDNLEQIPDAWAQIGAWARAVPECAVLVTSRRPLEVEGERRIDLGGLEPEPAADLFVARAGSASPGFALPSAHADVAVLVSLLEHIPLAIELAAARTRLMPVADLAARLRGSLKLLRSKTGPERHRTLRAAIAWSWSLLEPWEKAALQQLALFRGGCSLAAAEAVLDLSAFPGAPAVVDVIADLIDHSLLRSWRPGYDRDAVRVAPYEAVREFVGDEADPEVTATARQRLITWAAAWARHHAEGVHLGRLPALAAMRDEVANLRLAFEAAVGAHPAEAVSCLITLSRYYQSRIPPDEHLALLERGIAACGDEDVPGAWALYLSRARLQMDRVAYAEATRSAQAALDLARRLDDPQGEARSLVRLGMADSDNAWSEATRERFDAALEIARELGDVALEGFTLVRIGNWYQTRGELESAEGVLREAIGLLSPLDAPILQASAPRDLGDVMRRQGRLTEALAQYTAAASRWRVLGHPWQIGVCELLRGVALVDLGRPSAARDALGEAARLVRLAGSPHTEGIALTLLGTVATELGRWDEAERQLQQGLRLVGPDSGWALGDAHQALARLRFDQGLFAQGLEHVEAAEPNYDTPSARASNALLRGVGRWASGDPEAAQALRPALQALERVEERASRARAEAMLGSVLGPETDEGRALLAGAAGRLEPLGLPVEQAFVRVCAGDLAAADETLEDGTTARATSLLVRLALRRAATSDP